MSSLKDIMVDVDVDPLESQALRRTQTALQQPQSRIQNQSRSQSPATVSPNDQSDKQSSIKRRKSNRTSAAPIQALDSRPTSTRRRSSGPAEPMDPAGYQHGSPPLGPRTYTLSPRSVDTAEFHRYTPVTGRISRAKKGQPVHVCHQCEEPRIFSRAEHLRRHELSHQQPRYVCTFPECEKEFYRPDLLARHMNRHETQGEKAHKRIDGGSQSPSSSTDLHGSPRSTEAILGQDVSTVLSGSLVEPSTPRQANTTRPGTDNTYGHINNSLEFKNTHTEGSESQMSGAISQHSYATNPGATSGMENNQTLAFHHETSPGGSLSGNFMSFENSDFNPTYVQIFQPLGPSHNQPTSPTGQVPDIAFPPSLSYANSPWTSSESACHTPSDASHWNREDSASVVTNHGWVGIPSANFSHLPNLNFQEIQSSVMHMVPENYESSSFPSPRLSPPMVSYQAVGLAISGGDYPEDFMGAPMLSRPTKDMSQPLPMRSLLPAFSYQKHDGQRRIPVEVDDFIPIQYPRIPMISQEKLESYEVSCQTHVESIFPIIHPSDYQANPSELLKNARAALGAQFSNEAEDRQNGIFLNKSCKELVELPLKWTSQDMQGVLLTEIFGRFGSPNFSINPSSQFRKLYKWLLQSSSDDAKSPFANLNRGNIMALVNQSFITSDRTESQVGLQENILDHIWLQWIVYEVRQRLRSSCYVFDTHQAIYYGQQRVEPQVTTYNSLLVFPCPENLWSAMTSQQWLDQIPKSGCLTVQLSHPSTNTLQNMRLLPLSIQRLFLCYLMNQLPAQVASYTVVEFPDICGTITETISLDFPHILSGHAYLAHYHTPLHDLLSLAGDSWIFGQKIAAPADMLAIKERIMMWSHSPAAVRATWHACHVLRLFIQPQYPSNPSTSYLGVCDYWAAYTAALICWSFGRTKKQSHSHKRSPSAPGQTSSSGSNSVMASRRSSWTATVGQDDDVAMNHVSAQQYVDNMIGQGILLLQDAPMRRETRPMLKAVRWRLGIFAVEGNSQCAMLNDACQVLQHLCDRAR